MSASPTPHELRQAEEIRQLREELARVKGMELAPPPDLGELPVSFSAVMLGVMLPDFTRWVQLRHMTLRRAPSGAAEDDLTPTFLVVPDPAYVGPDAREKATRLPAHYVGDDCPGGHYRPDPSTE